MSMRADASNLTFIRARSKSHLFVLKQHGDMNWYFLDTCTSDVALITVLGRNVFIHIH